MNKHCVICGLKDERALTSITLEGQLGGGPVVVCGTHELIYRRSAARARSVEQLRSITLERRERTERRRQLSDDLMATLMEAFTQDRRAGADRRI